MSGSLILLILGGLFAAVIIGGIIYTALSRAKGHLQIILPKQLWQGGETLTGKVVLTPYKEIQCRRLSITVIHRVTNGSGKSRSTSTPYSEEKELASLGQFVPNVRREYEFQFNLPEHSLDTTPILIIGNTAKENPLYNVGSTLISNQNQNQQTWFLTATLDAEGIDLHQTKSFHCTQKANPNAIKIDASIGVNAVLKAVKWFMIMTAVMMILPLIVKLIVSLQTLN